MTQQARWQATWRALGAVPDARLYREVLARYREPWRRYHTLEHLACCFARFEEARDVAARPAEVELALWFHDVIYDPRRSDNEARSADWASAAVQAAGLAGDVSARVRALVLATRHDGTPQDPDARLVADVDLAILGSEAAGFDEYERRIREEYAWLPEADFRAGRSALLQRLLARPCIYGTEYFRERYEAQARRNLARALTRLGRG